MRIESLIKYGLLGLFGLGAHVSVQSATKIAVSKSYTLPIVKAIATSGLCPGNDLHFYKLGPATNNLGERFTIKCQSGNFSGTTENEIQIDTSGGSVGAFLQSTKGSSEPQARDGVFMSSSVSGCTSAAGSGNYAFIALGRLKTCPANSPLTTGKVVGGFMEMPPYLYAYQGIFSSEEAYRSFSIQSALAATYGIAVSPDFYEALQDDQGLVVGLNNTTPNNQPTISRAGMASLMGDAYNEMKLKGLKFFAPSKSEDPIIYCKLPRTSGAQAFANTYFLGLGPLNDGAMGGATADWPPYEVGDAEEIFEKVTARVYANIGEVKGCLNAPGKSIAILPGTENPISSGDQYRFVKLNRVEFSEGTVNATNTLTARSGEYDFASEIVSFNPTDSRIINAILERLYFGGGVGVYINGGALDNSFIESSYGRGGNPASMFQLLR